MTYPLVLIPGMMCDARLFTPQIHALSSICSLSLATPYPFTSMAEMAQSILDHSPPKFALAGLSMGGIIAMEIMAKSPERVTKLALLDTNPKEELEEVKAKREPQMNAVNQGELLTVMQQQMIPMYFGENEPICTDIATTCTDMAMSLGPRVFINQSKALRDRVDQQQTLAKVDIPTLILCGKEDQLCPINRHELMHELISNSVLEIVSGAGHLPTLQQPKKVNEIMEKWLKL